MNEFSSEAFEAFVQKKKQNHYAQTKDHFDKNAPIDINAIKSRLGSVPVSRINLMSAGIRRLLKVDLPALIAFFEQKTKTGVNANDI